ncbi:MAG: purine-nucleoside phosphorylase [Thermofilum sp.]
MAKPLHILAKPGEVAPRVVAAGDPARVRQLAGKLEQAKLVNENRGFLVYTGKYEGVPVTVATHGIGAPSAAIVFEELVMLGAKLIIRFGTCGGLLEKMRIGEMLIATGASYAPGGTLATYTQGDCMAAVPDYDVLKALVENAVKENIKFYVGPVVSSDNFYAGLDSLIKWRARGMIGVEMEAATLFTIGRLKGVKTGAAFIISDVIGEVYEKMATAEELREAVDKASRAVLRTAISLEV